VCLCFILGLLVFPSDSYSHKGGLDELGGHFRNKDCVYLLHEPTSLAKSAKDMHELIELIQTYNSNNCKNNLTKDNVDLGGHSFNGINQTEQAEVQNESGSTSSTLKLGKTYSATLEKCTDGDTAVFNVNGTSYPTRFLFIDTPESTNQKEPYGKEASEFTCSFLKEGSITLETDGNTLFDKYDRLLAWVFVEDKLHQEEITKAGLVEDFYDFGTYNYEKRVRQAMDEAKENSMGIYDGSDKDQGNEPLLLFLVIGILIIYLVYSKVKG
jgi:micrococcal nuclease